METNVEQKASQVNIRYTTESDIKYLLEWIQDPEIIAAYPVMAEYPREIIHCAEVWISYSRLRSSLTAEIDGIPCGLSTLYLHPYRKIAHQCEFGIIVGKGYRNQGVGTELINNIIHLAKTKFNIELLHLTVFEGIKAISLYKRFGFKEFARQEKWIKEKDGTYRARILMQREI